MITYEERCDHKPHAASETTGIRGVKGRGSIVNWNVQWPRSCINKDAMLLESEKDIKVRCKLHFDGFRE